MSAYGTESLTHACENITFPQLLLRTVIIILSKMYILFLSDLSNLTDFPTANNRNGCILAATG